MYAFSKNLTLAIAVLLATYGPAASAQKKTKTPTTASLTKSPTTKSPTTESPTTKSPTSATSSPLTSTPTYVPGELTVVKNGLRLSTGLDVRTIATKSRPVPYANGGQSSVNFHINPDGAAVFMKNDNSGNYFYVSNSETSGGGVGSIEFDANGNVVGVKTTIPYVSSPDVPKNNPIDSRDNV
jgi:hypothetical protein